MPIYKLIVYLIIFMKNILKFFLWSFLFFICLKFFNLKSEILEKIYQELIESKNLIENLQDKIFLNKDDKKIENLIKEKKKLSKKMIYW